MVSLTLLIKVVVIMKPKFSDLKLESGGLDELWDSTAGTIVCLMCGSYNLVGHIKACSNGLATVDWVCNNCGHTRFACCPFEDGLLTVVIFERCFLVAEGAEGDRRNV